MGRFVGRKDELERLNLVFKKKNANLIVIKGRRRIGKSRLAEEFAKGKNFIRFSGIPPTEQTTEQHQKDIFCEQLGKQLGLSGLRSTDWADLFTMLARETRKGGSVILFDEISWMGSKDPTFLGKLKNAWDIEFSKSPQLMLILCGSVSTWIEENIIKSTAFFGRISLYFTLDELPLFDCNKLVEEQGFKGSAYEKFKLLSIMGGIPWYLEQIQPKLSASENIKNICFRKEGMLFNEFDLIFHDLFVKRSETYKPIVEILAQGAMEFNAITGELNYAKSGVLSQYLEDLIEAGFVTRDYTWLLKTGKISRLSHFRLSDNYMRFYLKYIAPNRVRIINNHFKNISMSSLPGWNSMMGLQFENLVLKNRQKIHELLGIRAEDIVVDNPYFQRKTVRTAGLQIDYLIQTKYNTLFVCEIKFSGREINLEVVTAVKEKIDRLAFPRRFSCQPVLIHVNGVEEGVVDSGFFSEIIDFGSFLAD